MPLHIVQLYDKPNMQELREKYMDAHLAWIEQNRSWVLMAGSMREGPGLPTKGGLWIVEAKDKAEVLQKIGADPFMANGIRQSIDVFFWGLASPDMNITAAVFSNSAMPSLNLT